jgi:hypothetical protein
MPGMDGGIIENLPTIVIHKLIAKGGGINREGQGENNDDPLPGRKAGSKGRDP